MNPLSNFVTDAAIGGHTHVYVNRDGTAGTQETYRADEIMRMFSYPALVPN